MQTKPRKSLPFFTIVIPSLNEGKYISNLLEDLTKQTFKDFAVIHVDGNSKDKTVAESKKFEKKLDLTVMVVKKQNVSFQRNAGGNLAKSKWIVFMDSDNRLPNYFLQGLRYQIDKHEAEDGVDLFTTWLAANEDKKINKTLVRTMNFGLELYDILGKESAFGALIGVRKKIFNKINFDEKQKIFEDGLFVQEVIGAGHTYELFKEPRYNFSLRRSNSEGAAKMIAISAKMNINYLLGKKFDKKDFGYVMKGGEYYEDDKKTPLTNIQKLLETATKEQLAKARKIWKNLKA